MSPLQSFQSFHTFPSCKAVAPSRRISTAVVQCSQARPEINDKLYLQKTPRSPYNIRCLPIGYFRLYDFIIALYLIAFIGNHYRQHFIHLTLSNAFGVFQTQPLAFKVITYSHIYKCISKLSLCKWFKCLNRFVHQNTYLSLGFLFWWTISSAVRARFCGSVAHSVGWPSAARLRNKWRQCVLKALFADALIFFHHGG